MFKTEYEAFREELKKLEEESIKSKDILIKHTGQLELTKADRLYTRDQNTSQRSKKRTR